MGAHFISTTAIKATCPWCKAKVLEALDEGLRARVDAEPLPDPRGEADALLRGRRTYTRTLGGQLIHRDADRIVGGRLTGPIHVEHRCDTEPTTLF